MIARTSAPIGGSVAQEDDSGAAKKFLHTGSLAPAKAGAQGFLEKKELDSRCRGNERRELRMPEHKIVAMNHFGAALDAEDERNVA